MTTINSGRACSLFISLAFTCTSHLARGEAQAEQRPNVVLILADDLGWSDLGCYGGDLHETPNLDSLAKSGVRFTDAYAASVCSPTRASLLTGKHYARLGITVWREASLEPPRDQKLIPPVAVADLPHNEVALAEAFHSAGYLTAIVGKWHLGDAKYYPETQGFDINIGGTLWGAPQTYFFPYRGSSYFGRESRYVPQLDDGHPGDYLTDQLTDEALRVIDRAGDQPFFLYLAHYGVHTPLEAKPELVRRYEAKLKPDLHHRNPVYAAMVHSLDESVGRILKHLESKGLAERTIIVFLSDNGGHVIEFEGKQITDNHPLRSGKGSLYEGGIRIPLLIRWPGSELAGEVCREPVYVADIFPTLLEMTGIKAKHGQNASLDGQTFAPLLKDPDARLHREALYFHYPHYYPTTTPVSAVRTGDWKLLEYYEDNLIELYNLRDDLGETNNLASKQRDKANELRIRLTEWRSAIGARTPTKN